MSGPEDPFEGFQGPRPGPEARARTLAAGRRALSAPAPRPWARQAAAATLLAAGIGGIALGLRKPVQAVLLERGLAVPVAGGGPVGPGELPLGVPLRAQGPLALSLAPRGGATLAPGSLFQVLPLARIRLDSGRLEGSGAFALQVPSGGSIEGTPADFFAHVESHTENNNGEGEAMGTTGKVYAACAVVVGVTAGVVWWERDGHRTRVEAGQVARLSPDQRIQVEKAAAALEENAILRARLEALEAKSAQPGAQPRTVQTAPPPVPASADPSPAGIQGLAERLAALDPKDGAGAATRLIHQLVAAGEKSVPAIQALLESGKDIQYRTDPLWGPERAYGECPTLRVGLLNALRQIGGKEATQAALAVLPDTQNNLEIYEISQVVLQTEDSIQPHRERFLAALRNQLLPASDPPPGVSRMDIPILTADMIFHLGGVQELAGELEQAGLRRNFRARSPLGLLATALEPPAALQSLQRIYEARKALPAGQSASWEVVEAVAQIHSTEAHDYLRQIYPGLSTGEKAYLVSGLQTGLNLVGSGTRHINPFVKDFDPRIYRSGSNLPTPTSSRPVTPETAQRVLRLLQDLEFMTQPTEQYSNWGTTIEQIRRGREIIETGMKDGWLYKR